MPNSTSDWQHFMHIPPSHFKLAQMTTPEGAQQRIRRSLLVPKAKSPQEKSPPDRPAHEIGAFHVVRKSNDPFNTTWCWPSERRAGWCAILLTTAVSSSQTTSACLCALSTQCVRFPTARSSATANQRHFAVSHGPTEIFQLTQDTASGVKTAETMGCLCSISVSRLVHSDLTPDLVSKYN